MKKFKTKRKIKIIKPIILLIIGVLSMYYTLNICIKTLKYNMDIKKYVKYLINEGFNNQITNYEDNILNITNPINMLQNNLNFKYEEQKEDILTNLKEVNEEIKEPLVYIYNTHDEEKYQYISNGAYNIVPNVKLVSLMLDEKLNDLGIKTITEETPIKSILNNNNWIYKDSYKASRLLLEDTYKNNKSLKYFIDIHRDSMNKDITTIEYNNNTYAKILFVIGKENETYNNNLEFANILNNKLNEIIPDISRGISIKEGIGVDGVYNQDFSDNLLLIEIGGCDNNIIEVSNTVNILADVLYKYIKEDNYEKEKI